MIKKTITYTDYNGLERTEDFWFNITEAEALEMEMSTTGGFGDMIRRVVAAQDMPTIIKVFKDFIFKAYGEKSPDGKRFIKSEELSTAFSQTDATKAAEFVNGVIPNKKPAASQHPAIAPVNN